MPAKEFTMQLRAACESSMRRLRLDTIALTDAELDQLDTLTG